MEAQGPQGTPPGWHPNPQGPGQRYWDGMRWTDNFVPPTGAVVAASTGPTYCRACAASIDVRAVVCPKCGVAQAATPSPLATQGHTRKEPGLAILFSFLWLGAGHLYVGDNTTGIVLISVEVVNFLLSLTLIWLVIGFPLWLGLFIWAAIDTSKKAKAHNAQYGFA